MRPLSHRGLHDFDGTVLTDEKYFGIRREFANLPACFHSIQDGETDVEENQIRLELLRQLDRFQAVRRLTNNPALSLFVQR